jgi:STE24 endopeptidase
MSLANRAVVSLCLMALFAAFTPRLDAEPVATARRIPPESSPSQYLAVETSYATTSQQQAYALPREKLAKAIALSRIRSVLGVASTLWGILVLWLVLASGLATWLEARTRRVSDSPAVHGLLYFTTIIILLTMAGLPISCYGHHVGLSFGISVQGWGPWLADQGKTLALSLFLSAPLMLLMHWIMRRSPRRYWIWAWLLSLPIMVFGVFIEPLSERLFYEFEPLAKSNPALVSELEKVVARTGTSIPPERMFLMKASVKTNGLNAYVNGLGATRRIVVWDTTVGRIPDDEILYIFAHESGHYVLNHILQGMVAGAVGFLVMLWACAGVAGWLVSRFGAQLKVDDVTSLAGFVVLLLTLAVASFVTDPVTNAFSRHIEHEADVYGQEAVHGIVADPQKTAVASFNALGEAWLEDPNPNPIVEFWEYSHPSVKNRANFAAHYDPWANRGHGKFFDK